MASAFDKYPKLRDGEVVVLPRGRYGMCCCDCSLVHDLHVKVNDKGDIQLQAFRNETETKLLRDERAGRFITDASPKTRKRRIRAEDVVEDGQTVSVSLAMMDSWQRDVHDHYHQPHTVPGYTSTPQNIADARAAARSSYIARQTSAWKYPGAQQFSDAPSPRPRYQPPEYTPPSASEIRSLRDAARASRDAWVSRAQSAWKTAPLNFSPRIRDAAQPDVSNLPDPADVQRRRDAEYATRVQNLQNAWKSPVGTGNPNRAAAIEAARRDVTNEDRR
jgi:hypothetical protein